MSDFKHHYYISSKYDISQTGYGLVELPYDNTILYLSDYPFIMTCDDYIFNSDLELVNYFNDNPTKKVDGTIAIVNKNGEQFYECVDGEFINNTDNIRWRIRKVNSLIIFTGETELNCYLNDNFNNILYAPKGHYTGLDRFEIKKIKFINTAGEKFGFRALVI